MAIRVVNWCQKASLTCHFEAVLLVKISELLFALMDIQSQRFKFPR